MPRDEKFYAKADGDMVTFLEFGAIDIATQYKRIWGFILHQEAYDFYMLARYTRDLFLTRDILRMERPGIANVVQAVDKTAHKSLASWLLKYVMVASACEKGIGGGTPSICETGQTLFALIDEVQAVSKALGQNIGEQLAKSRYVGCDISGILNRAAQELHPNIEMTLYDDATAGAFAARGAKYDVFYSSSISLQYSLHSSSDLVAVCRPAVLTILNQVRFSLDKTREIKLGTGKYGHNVGLPGVYAKLRKERPDLSWYYQPATAKLFEPGFQSAALDKIDFKTLELVLMVAPQPVADAVATKSEAVAKCVIEAGFGDRLPKDWAEWRPLEDISSQFSDVVLG